MRCNAMHVFAMPVVTMRGKNKIVLFLPWTDIAVTLWRFRAQSQRRRTRKRSMEWVLKPRRSPKP